MKTLSFRGKTIVGIALIEGVLLLVLVWSSMDYLRGSIQDELNKRARTTSQLFAAMAKNPVLSTDLATLDTVTHEMLQTPGIVYVRVLEGEQVLSQKGQKHVLERSFKSDVRFEESDDGIFDISAPIIEGTYQYGRVELGLSVAPLKLLIADAQTSLLGISAAEMILVAIFSYILGTYLTRALNKLTVAAKAISQGELGVQVNLDDTKELRRTALAFNSMSRRLQESHIEMNRNVERARAMTEKLSQSEKRLSTILQTAADGIITIDSKGIIQSINQAGEKTFGYNPGELIGENVSILMGLPHRHQHDSYIEGYLNSGKSSVLGKIRDLHGLCKDGCIFPMDLSISEMRLGNQRMFVGVVRDISERKEMELKIRKNEAIKGAIVESALDAIVAMDRDGLIIEFSPVATQIFGYERDSVLGKSLAEVIIPPEYQKQHQEGLKNYLDSGESTILKKRIEVNAIRRSGDRFPVELAISPIQIDGEIMFTAYIRDISIQKASEQLLKQAKQQAETASEAKSRFLAHMSHEIRSPLSAVLGAIGLLMESDLDKQQRLCAHTAQTSGKALLGLINDILDFSKIEAGQLTLEMTSFNLRDLISGVVEVVAYRAYGKSLDIVARIEAGTHSQFVSDPGRLRQVLLNLVDNAAKFTKKGAVVLSVHQDDTGKLHFEVQDTGIGISAEAQQLLFKEFSQVDNSDSTSYGGTGLGLAISRQIIEAMGGAMEVQSKPGKGSLFSFIVPVKLPEKTVIAPLPDNLRYRIILVGLAELARNALQAQLEDFGCYVESYATLKQWLDKSGSDTLFDYYLLDENNVGLPGELPSIQEKYPGIQLVLISKTNSLEGSTQMKTRYYQQIIYRPLHPDAVLAAISQDSEPQRAGVDSREQDNTDCVLGGRILLAEDSPANQLVASSLLKKAGFEVDLANNGLEAVEAYKTGKYDLILMDMRMPEMDGLEATKRIVALGEPVVPIIALTANALKSDIQRCLEAGMVDYVTKPVEKEILLNAMNKVLKTSALGAVVDLAGKEEPLIIEAALNKLAEDTSPEQVPIIVSTFLIECDSRMNRLLAALKENLLEQIQDEAHVLKSLAGTFGAVQLQKVARDLEEACRENSGAKVRQLGSEMQVLYNKTVCAFRERYKEAS